MARFSLPVLLYSTATSRRFSSDSMQQQLRNVWISGLLDPSKVRVTERYWLYTGDIDKMIEARKETEKRDKYYESIVKEESWLNQGKKRDSRRHFKWLMNGPTSDSTSADLTFFNWRKQYKMSVLDTPDNVDFTAEVQNALRAFDGAILVLSGVDGVNSHSISVDKQMMGYELPRLVFINNLDHKGANPWGVLYQARSKLQHHIAAVQVPIGLEYNFKGLVDLVHLKAYFFHDSNGQKVFVEEVPGYMEALVSQKRRELIKTVSEVDDKLAEAFSGDKPISAADLEEAVRRATIARKFIPIFMGSAFKYKGLQLLLDGVLNYLPCPTEASNYALVQSKNEEKGTLVALAFTLKRKYDLLTYLRIYDGIVRKGDFITNVDTGKTFKVPDSIEMRKDEIGVPHPLQLRVDKKGVPYVIGLRNEVPYSTEPRKDDLGVPLLIGLSYHEAIQVARAGEIVAVHDPLSAPGDTFTDGLVRYTKSSVDVSELISRDSGVQVSIFFI
ncbi:putative translation elongation factor EFTu/EF1A, bacterial/organelle [Medicago truncatula]|uniref:Putative translation elongation factor EFTu/EF1A, bacterial/organelle n=1 Tax=Medicago truncatula TaxID=3880 RepID=A0A396J3Z2_MEDTR|nr:putative translation elongation factor EFTu/EF1A, bacterial/organelle [Medicago truncatula]